MKHYVFSNIKDDKKIINANDMIEAKLAYIRYLVEQYGLSIFGTDDDSICEDKNIKEIWNAADWLCN